MGDTGSGSENEIHNNRGQQFPENQARQSIASQTPGNNIISIIPI